MADKMKEKHRISKDYIDSFCDPCFEAKRLKVKVYGYCKDCSQFLCSDCHVFHGKFQVTKFHVILKGSSMPPRESQADRSSQVSQVKAIKQCGHNIKIEGDYKECYITGMSMTKDGRILMADSNNVKVKLFSRAMEFLSSVSVPERRWYMFFFDSTPTDIAVINDSEAVVTTTNNLLVLLDISGTQLNIKATTEVPYRISGITKYKSKLVVSSYSISGAFVNLIDLTGKVYWSLSADQQGTPLFWRPQYLTSHDEGRSSTVIVTDQSEDMLTLLNGETGEFITRRPLQRKFPKGVTTDAAGNVYVCYWNTSEISVLSGDLSEEKILLSSEDGLNIYPKAIVYDDKTNQLFISCKDKAVVNSFKLSYM